MYEVSALSKPDVARLLYKQGSSCVIIAHELHVSRTTVWRWCRAIIQRKHATKHG